jgi:hypothetical protein
LKRTELKKLIAEYVSYIETKETGIICKCTWRYRDTDKEGNPTSSVRVRSHQHPHCIQHTKEGFLLGFIDWLVSNGKVPSRRITLPTNLELVSNEPS